MAEIFCSRFRRFIRRLRRREEFFPQRLSLRILLFGYRVVLFCWERTRLTGRLKTVPTGLWRLGLSPRQFYMIRQGGRLRRRIILFFPRGVYIQVLLPRFCRRA